MTNSLNANSQVKKVFFDVNVSNNNGNIFSLGTVLKKSKILLNNNKYFFNIVINIDTGFYDLHELLSFNDLNINNLNSLIIIGKDKQRVRFKTDKIVLNNCKNILFKNITIESVIGDGVSINNSSNISFLGCQIRNTAGWAFSIANSKKVTVQSCDISGNGKGAIYIQSMDRSGNIFENNYIHDLVKSNFLESPAVKINGFGNTFKNNLFTNIANEAILCNEGENLIEFNEFVNCSFNNGIGVVYSNSIKSKIGNIIKYNYLHDNKKVECGGLFLNNCKNMDTVYGNIFKNVDNALSINNNVNYQLTNNMFINCNSVFVSRPFLQNNKLRVNKQSNNINNNTIVYTKIENNICIGGFWDVNSFDLQPTTDSLFYTNQIVKNNLFDFTTRISKKVNASTFIVKVNYAKADVANPFYDNFNIETSNFPENFRYIQIPFQQIGINIKQWSNSIQ